MMQTGIVNLGLLFIYISILGMFEILLPRLPSYLIGGGGGGGPPLEVVVLNEAVDVFFDNGGGGGGGPPVSTSVLYKHNRAKKDS